MNIRKYRFYKALIAFGLAVAIGIAVVTETPVIALAAVIAAVAVAIAIERSNKEIVRDERIVQISGKAASATFNTVVIVAALASLGIALFHSKLPENIVFVGTIMGYFICVALLLQICFYAYFSRKL